MRLFNRLFSVMLLMSAFSVYAGPMLNVGALNEFIQPNSNTLAKRIYNSGDVTAFVRVEISEIFFNTDNSYLEKPIEMDSIVNGKASGLISSPPRLIIPADGRQTNRLLFVGNRDVERYFRVRYIPVIPAHADEFGLSERIASEYAKTINAGLTVLTGFGTIITVQPTHQKFNTVLYGRNHILDVTNKGNTSVVLSGLKACDINLNNCSESVNVQLRPGKNVKRISDIGKVWSYTLIEGGSKKQVNGK